MNAFSKNYEPQLTWKDHDKSLKYAPAGAKGAAMTSAQVKLPGSLTGGPKLMPIPSRDSINTDTTKQRDRTDMIRRGGR
jgi:hypothetical protein